MCEPEQAYPPQLYADPESDLFPTLPKSEDSEPRLLTHTHSLPSLNGSTSTAVGLATTTDSTKVTVSVKLVSLSGSLLEAQACEFFSLNLFSSSCSASLLSSQKLLAQVGNTSDLLLCNESELKGRCSALEGGISVFQLLVSYRVEEVDASGSEGVKSLSLPLSLTNNSTSPAGSEPRLFDAAIGAYIARRDGVRGGSDDGLHSSSLTSSSIAKEDRSHSNRRSQFYGVEVTPSSPSATGVHQEGQSMPVDEDTQSSIGCGSSAPSSAITRGELGGDAALPQPTEVRFTVTVVPMGAIPSPAPHVSSATSVGDITLPCGFDVHETCPKVDENPLSTGFTRRAFSAMIKNARRAAYQRDTSLVGFADSAHEEEPAVQRSCLGVAENLRKSGSQLLSELQALQNTLQRGSSRRHTPTSSTGPLPQLSSSLRQSPIEAKVALVQLCLVSIEAAESATLTKVHQDLHTLMEVVSCSSSVALEALSVTDGNMENALNMMLSNPLLATQSAEQLGRFALSILDTDAVLAVCDERYLRGSKNQRLQQQANSVVPQQTVAASPHSFGNRVGSALTNRTRSGSQLPQLNTLEACRDALIAIGHHPEVVAPLTRIANGKVDVCQLALGGDDVTQRRVVQRSDEVAWYGLFIQQLIARWSKPGGPMSPPRASANNHQSLQANVLKETYFPEATASSSSANGISSSTRRAPPPHHHPPPHVSRGPPIRGGIGGLGSWSDYPADINVDSVLEAIVLAKEMVSSLTSQAEGVSALWHSPAHHPVMKVACQAFVDYIVASTHHHQNGGGGKKAPHPVVVAPPNNNAPHSNPPPQPSSSVRLTTASTSSTSAPSRPHQHAAPPLPPSPAPSNHSQVPLSRSNRGVASSPLLAGGRGEGSSSPPPSLSSNASRPSQSAPPPLPSPSVTASSFSSPNSSSISYQMSFSSANGVLSRSSTPVDSLFAQSPPSSLPRGSGSHIPGQSPESWGSTGNLSSSHRFTVPRMPGPPALRPQSPPPE